MNTLSSPMRSMKPVDARISRTSNFTRASAKTMSRSVQRLAHLLKGVDCCQVYLGVGLRIQQEPLDRGSAASTAASARRLKSSALAKNSGAS